LAPRLKMLKQIPLDIRLDTDFTFENFYKPKVNSDTLASIKSLIKEPEILILEGQAGSGKTHLLQAVCHSLASGSYFYIPASMYVKLEPAALQITNSAKLIVIDDVEFLLGDVKWETSLFELYNLAFDNNISLIFSTCQRAFKFKLPDLESRFAKLRRLKLTILSDEAKLKAWQLHAANRGLKIDEKVASFVQSHYSRNMHDLLDLLNKLDKYSISHKRSITIPLVKKVLESSL